LPLRRTGNAIDRSSLIENVSNPEQKRQIIQKLTDAMASIEGENMRGVTGSKFSEVTSGEWGIGGQPLTAGAVKDLAAGRTGGVGPAGGLTSLTRPIHDAGLGGHGQLFRTVAAAMQRRPD
jgi:4-oxalocrotonate tautomerase